VTVFVDDWRQPARVGRVEGRWSHLVGDDEAELHAFARRLGLRRAWFQEHPGRAYRDHYDVTDALRAAAIELGATPVTWRDMGRLMRQRRAEAAAGAVPRERCSIAGSGAGGPTWTS
jgi:hypothetical protein